jgi:hypothetical protein
MFPALRKNHLGIEHDFMAATLALPDAVSKVRHAAAANSPFVFGRHKETVTSNDFH